MAPLDSTSSTAPAWQAALGEVRRAGQRMSEAEADDPAALAEVAAHLRRAWGLLGVELLGSADDDAAVAALAERIHAPTLAGEELARRLVFAEPDGDEATRLLRTPGLAQGLRLELGALRRAADEFAARRDGSAITGMGLLFAVTTLLAFAPLIGDIGGTVTAPWRGLYYDNERFEGDPRERFDRTIEFDFGKDSPIRGVGVDAFSIRWDTCIAIEEDTKVRFELASDDGSRLYIDGERIIDNWGDHGTETRNGSATLEAGSHHMMIEYYEARHGANIALRASFDSDKLETIPVDMLTAPLDGDDPCP
ncbi:PA14 domain-containing protein [Paraliomyxa miuraensis]|uniref:PA14 domain-containing protein n=1 Tax=Paraliomyxa miuraensis TaxID=376150 RepID=UPI0022542272|nr:PA14 domain-containing protein [Paraliomyxa miuraensis]MCX4244486.1 PA14 domain-containing protein [Paraliomyxa miuraensis]